VGVVWSCAQVHCEHVLFVCLSHVTGLVLKLENYCSVVSMTERWKLSMIWLVLGNHLMRKFEEFRVVFHLR